VLLVYASFLPRWLGPCTITAQTGPVNYTLDFPDHYSIHDNFHVSMPRHAYDNCSGLPRLAPTVIAIQKALGHGVETILGHKPATMQSQLGHIRAT